jgi:hypothetical protein
MEPILVTQLYWCCAGKLAVGQYFFKAPVDESSGMLTGNTD